MALTLLEENLNIIQGLADLPNSDDGLDPDELKAKFDEAVNIIKDYINKTLIPEVESDIDAASQGISSGRGVDGEKLVDGSVTEAKLADASITSTKIASKAVTAEKIADNAVSRAQLAEDATTLKTEDFPNKVVPNRALDDNAVTNVKIADAAVTPAKLDRPYLSLGLRTMITPNSDLNNYLTPGSYGMAAVTVGTISNAPTNLRFILDVFNSGGYAEVGADAYRYFAQIVTESSTAKQWVRTITFDGTSTPTYGGWGRIMTSDDLYSPIQDWITSRTLTVADIGKTMKGDWNAAVTLTLTQANSAQMPVGAEIAVFNYSQETGQGTKIVGNGVRFFISGDNANYTSATIKVADPFGMIVLKKFSNNTNLGDGWLVTGNVEVV